jgi:hypothetical protein
MMLDQDFCTCLEYEICKALENSELEELKGGWCDGIWLPKAVDNYSQKHINDHKEALLKAFIGKDGQTEFELILKFGDKALNRYARNLDIQECVPESDKTEWFVIDIKNKKIQIQLH